MNSLRFLSVLFSALYANAQIQTPPSNVSTGFVRVPSTGFRALGAAAPVKQISFFYTPTGLVAYDGDIIFGTIEEFNRALINVTYNSISNATDDDSSSSNEDNNSTTTKRTVEKRQPRDRTRFAVAERSNSIFPGSSGIWPGSKVSYRYSNDATENELSPYVEPAIDAWTDAVPCLSFEKLPNSEDTSNDNGVVNIVAHNPNIGACFASIGYGPYSLWMSLDTGGACGVAEVKHEWGHILGLMHEQKRPDSYLYNRFVCSNLIDYPFGLISDADADSLCCGAAPDYGCCGWACQFTPDFGFYNLQDPVPENGGAYDLNSIMLYRNDAFAKSGTFTLLDGPNAYNNPQNFSSGDINRIKELYCSIEPPDDQCPVSAAPSCKPAAGQNRCSFPTAQTCVFPSPSTRDPRAACACRAGFKATTSEIADTDTSKQWRLPADEGSFRVWVAEGVACDTPCDYTAGTDICSEVTELPKDCLHT